MTGDGSFGVAVKAAIVDGPRLLALYKTHPEWTKDLAAAYRCARSRGDAQLTVEHFV